MEVIKLNSTIKFKEEKISHICKKKERDSILERKHENNSQISLKFDAVSSFGLEEV